jgi:hypothetical protein
MKIPFVKRDPAAALAQAKAKHVAERTAVVELKRQRAGLLADADDLNEVKKLDRRIAERRQAIALLADRVAALAERAVKHRADRREQARQAAIDTTLAPAVAELVKDAAELEAALLTAVERFRSVFDKRTAIVRQRWCSAPAVQFVKPPTNLPHIAAIRTFPEPKRGRLHYAAIIQGQAGPVVGGEGWRCVPECLPHATLAARAKRR